MTSWPKHLRKILKNEKFFKRKLKIRINNVCTFR
jgi:hypothetical protein